MSTSAQSQVFAGLTYSDYIKEQIISSGGTIIHTRDNIIIASEISEAEYRQLLESPFIDKLDVLPFKRYANEGIKYEENQVISAIKSDIKITNASDILK